MRPEAPTRIGRQVHRESPGHEPRRPPLSPTIFHEDGFRFFFFSREEFRLHVHVHHADGEAKFWLEPQIEPAQNYGLSDRQIRAAEALVRKHEDDIRAAWRRHFGR